MGKKCRGAISIFMIIIMMSCFMLGGIFIDATRVLVAKNKVNLAMDASVRSAMSYYDKDLVNEFGLYAVYAGDEYKSVLDKDEKPNNNLNKKFNKYLKANMLKAQDDGINLFRYQIYEDATSMQPVDTLQKCMGQQILEYEKYRAPVNTVTWVADIVKRLKELDKNSGGLEGLDKCADTLNGLNDSIKNASANLVYSGEVIRINICSKLVTSVKNCVTNVLKMDAKTASTDDIKKSVSSAMTDAREEIAKMKKELKTLKEKRDEYRAAANNVAGPEGGGDASLLERVDANSLSKASSYDENVDKEIAELEKDIAKLEKEIAAIEGSLNREVAKLDTLIEDWRTKENALTDAKRELKAANEALEKAKKDKGIAAKEAVLSSCKSRLTDANNLIYTMYAGLLDDEAKADYVEYKVALTDEDTEKQEEIADKYHDNNSMNKLLAACRDKYETEQQVQEAQADFDAAMESINAETNRVEAAQARVNAAAAEVEACKKKIETQGETIQTEVKKLEKVTRPDVDTGLLPELASSVKDVVDEDKGGLFGGINDMLKSLTAEMPEIGENTEPSDETGVVKVFKQIASEFTTLLDLLDNGLSHLGHKFLYVDYIMGNFTYLTSQTERDHYFDVGEVEYILNGYKNQMDNVAKTVTEIYTLRVAIDAIYYFKYIPGGFLERIVGAIGLGMLQAIDDLKDMIVVPWGKSTVEGCELYPTCKVKLTYSDHLRLLLFMEFNEKDNTLIEKTINATLTKEKKGKGTEDLYTSAKAEAEIGVNLVMIPLFTDMLPLNDYFRDGQFIIHKTVNYSY